MDHGLQRPAIHLASKFKPRALMLVCPIKSVKSTANKLAGSLVDYFLYERFNNIDQAKKVSCPTMIIHGMQDELVQF